jgi:hypothetical protein
MDILKRCIIFSTALIFLNLCVFPAIDAEFSTTFNQPEIPEMITEEITLYRVDTNGLATPVQVSIIYKKGQDSEAAIAEKCKELCKNDEKMKQSVGTNGDWPIQINSSGNGTHRAFRRIIFPHRNVIWRLVIQYTYLSEDSYTNVTINGIEKSWKGPHSVRINGFTGYVNFKPRRLLGLRLFGNTIIQGYAKGIEYGSPN